ncbi:hypothetical protein [Flavobacterium orientale]|uniref:Lipoprotein n=1 Tax=Flavobacterium orientale TaxID=1756020 RepID=A0A916Y9N9_9FLAO|nr:hypothetical protein [Flavobacterium orientale]GGD36016.1 hypothetical protein GCM10011343_27350 [Flavobacterium orientale]
MRKIAPFVCLFVIFFSCERSIKKQAAEVVSSEATTAALTLSCYEMSDGDSQVKLKITDVSDSISGYLNYSLSGKDKNTGTVKGVIQGAIFYGVFDFVSEGIASSREVAFKIQEGRLIEGFGDIEVSGNQARFKNKSLLTFSESIVLQQVTCTASECPVDFGYKKSLLREGCIDTSALTPRLNPLENGAMVSGDPAFVIFSKDLATAEVFLPQEKEGFLLTKGKDGNWTNEAYQLIAWKGFVLQKNGTPIFGGQ